MIGDLAAKFRAELAAQFVVIVAGGAVTVGLARLLSPAEYGLLFLAISVFAVIGVCSKLGIAKSGARYVASYRQTDPEQVPHVLAITLSFNLAAIGVVAVGLTIGHEMLANTLGEPALAPYLLLGVGYLVFEALKTYVRIVLQGFEEIQFAAVVHALDQMTRAVFALGFALAGFGGTGALVGWILGFALATFVGGAMLYHRHYHRPARPREPDLLRSIGRYAVPLTATNSANVLDKRLDTVIVGVLLTPVAVSAYVIGKQVVQFVETPLEALGFTLSPTFGSLKAADDIAKARGLYEQALVGALSIYVPVAVGIALVADPVVPMVFGDGYAGAVPVLQVLSIYVVCQSVTKLTSNGLDYLGRARDRAIVKGITAVANVGLTVGFVLWIGVVGAAVATVATYAVYTLANVYIAHTEFDLRVGYLSRKFGVVCGVTAIMGGAVLVVLPLVSGPVTLLGAIAVGGVVWAVLAVATGLVDPVSIGHAVTS